MVDAVIVGTMALDSIETPFGKAEGVLGGSATYASYAASFFCRPGIVAVVGEDFPQDALQILGKRNISLDGLKKEKNAKTFRWQGSYEYDMNEAKTLKTELNVLASFKPDLPAEYRDARFIFLGNIDPQLQLDVLSQIRSPNLVIADTMNFWIEHKREKVKEVIKKIDVLLLNDGEARELFETPNLSRAGKSALGMGPRAVIIKKGEHGALLFTRAAHFSAPSYPLENVVDPTGCGDCFGGGLTGFLAKTDDVSEWNVRKAMIYGSAIASHNTEGFGLEVLKKISIVDVERRFNEFKSIREF